MRTPRNVVDRRRALALILALIIPAWAAFGQATPAGEHREGWRARGEAMADRAIAYLRSVQDDASGGWSHNPAGPNLPAISGLVLTGMLADPAIDWRDPDVAQGLGYVLGFVKPDGGIHDGFLPTYNTAICLSMLSGVPTAEAGSAVRGGLAALRRAQWGAYDLAAAPNPDAPDWAEPIDEDHPFYGGVGYGRNGRPDMSNTQFFLQAIRDAGVSSDDPAVERALVFLRRTQMDGAVNPMPYAEGSRQGGFIYATVPNTESVDSFPGQSQAGEMTETLADGTSATRLRAYGSMTYAGLKSLVYADLSRVDPRVEAAMRWIRSSYTLEENPGLGNDGLYYYYLSFARALDAWDEPLIEVEGGATRDWREDLVDALEVLQNEDGSFRSRSGRWMEDNPTLITAYALIALQAAVR